MKFTVINQEGKSYRFSINPERYIKDLKNKIEEIDGTPFDKINLILDCKILHDNNTIIESNLYEEAKVIIFRADRSLLLKSSQTFTDSNLFDRIHQSFIDLEVEPKEEEEVNNLLIEAISYLDDKIEVNFAKELFSLILSCFLHFPEQSLRTFSTRLQRPGLSIYHIILLPSILANLAQFHPKIQTYDYNSFISSMCKEVFAQISNNFDNQPIIFSGSQIPSYFRVSLITDLILLTDLDQENVKLFYPFIFSHSTIPVSKINFFISKVIDKKLISAIPESEIVENNVFLKFNIKILGEWLNSFTNESKQTFIKIFPLIDKDIIQKTETLPLLFATNCIYKCIDYGLKPESVIKLLFHFQQFTSDMTDLWDYLDKFDIKLDESFKPKIKSFPSKPYMLKILPLKFFSEEFINFALLEAKDFKTYESFFSLLNFKSKVLSDLKFWNHLIEVASNHKCDNKLMSEISLCFSKIFKENAMSSLFVDFIFKNFPPNEKQSTFLVDLFCRLPQSYQTAFFIIQGKDFINLLVNKKRLPPITLCKLFFFRAVHSDLSPIFLYEYAFSRRDSDFALLDSVEIQPLIKQSDTSIQNFINQKNNYNLVSSFDLSTVSLIACAIIFTDSKYPVKVTGLTNKNVIPFFAISFNYVDKNTVYRDPDNYLQILAESFETMSYASPLSIDCINSILSNIEYLLNPNYFPFEITQKILTVFFNSLQKGRYFSGKKYLIFTVFCLTKCDPYVQPKIKEIFKTYGDDLFKFIIKFSSVIVNFDKLENEKLDLNYFDSGKTSSLIKYNVQSKSSETVYQTIWFIQKYCKNIPPLQFDKDTDLSTALHEIISLKKWDQFSVIWEFMCKYNIKLNTQLIINKILHSKNKEESSNQKNGLDASEIVNIILSNQHPEKQPFLFQILFNTLMENFSVAEQYIEICLDKYVSDQKLQPSLIVENLSYLYDQYEKVFPTSLKHLYSYVKKEEIFVRRLKFEQLKSVPLDFGFLVRLTEEKSYQSFMCLQNIASSFPFFFEINPSKVIEIVAPTLCNFSKSFDVDLTDEMIKHLKTSCAAISYLFSCLYSTNFISFFVHSLFQNIVNLSNSQVFCFTSILLSLFKTPKVNIAVFSLAIKYDLLKIISTLLLREISGTSFKDYYQYNLYYLVAEYYNLFTDLKLNDALFIFQVVNNVIENPFSVKFDNFSTISQVTFSPLVLPLPKNEELKDFMNDINKIQPFWLTFNHSSSSDKSKSKIQSFLNSYSDSEQPYEVSFKIPQITIKMQKCLVSEPLWVFNWINNISKFPLLKDHQEYLVNVTGYLNKIKENSLKNPDQEDVPLVNSFNQYQFFNAYYNHQMLFESIIVKLNEKSNQLMSYFMRNHITMKTFISAINHILEEKLYLISTKTMKHIINYLYQLIKMNATIKETFINDCLLKLVYSILSPGFREDKNLLLESIQLFSLFNQVSPKHFAHLIGFLIIANNFKINLEFVDIYTKYVDGKNNLITPLFVKSFNNFMQENEDIQFDQLKIYLDKMPSLTTICISSINNFIGKQISKIRSANFKNKKLNDYFCTIINYFTPKETAQKSSSKFAISKKMVQDEEEKIQLYNAPRGLIEQSPVFWKEIYNDHRFFLSEFIQKDIMAIDKLQFTNDHSELIPFKPRLEHFKNQLQRIQNYHAPQITLQVSRRNILEDSYQFLQSKTRNQMFGRFNVYFIGERGSDAGGLTKEWFTLISKEFLKEDYALFKKNENESFHPNPLSVVNKDHISYFRVFGFIIGRALLDGIKVQAHFSISFLRQIMHKPTCFRDLQDYDSELYNSLQLILETDDIESLDLCFQIDDEVLGELKQIDLKENGENIQVTKENVNEYVNLYADYKLRKSVIYQIDAFSDGFDSIIPRDSIKLFTPNELDLLICGVPVIDVDDFKKNVEYGHGYHKNHPTIILFFDVISKWEQEDLAKLLMFITGTSNVSINGFKEFRERGNPIQISMIHDTDRFPQSHTCFNRLDLPPYTDEKDMNDKLYEAIQVEDYGFG